MRLTKEEMEAFKQQHLKALEAEEARRVEERQVPHEEPELPRETETSRRERELALAQLKEEIESDFYKRRGYKRYVNHRGKVLWLTPEEYRFRKDRKKKHRGMSGAPKKQRALETVLIFGATVLIALLAGFFLATR